MAFQQCNVSWAIKLSRLEMAILGDALGVLMTSSEIGEYPMKNFKIARCPLRHWRNMPSSRTMRQKAIA